MQARVKDVLVNPTWGQLVEHDPLVAVSFYLSGRKNVLLGISDEILENLDCAFADAVIDGGKLDRAESLFWLWTLGAYEVVRTLCQAKNCFSKALFEKLVQQGSVGTSDSGRQNGETRETRAGHLGSRPVWV